MRSLVLILMSMTCFGASAEDRIPDEVFVRHAKALIPELVADANRTFGRDLEVDLASVRVPKVRIGDIVHPSFLDQPTSIALLIPIRPDNACRRLDVTMSDGQSNLSVFVRAVGPRFKLVRTCNPDDTRPARVRLSGPMNVPPKFDSAELEVVTRPLVQALVAMSQPADVHVGLLGLHQPWTNFLAPADRDTGYFDLATHHACYVVDFDLPSLGRRGQTALDVTFDTDEQLTEVPASTQVVVNDSRRLRQFRFALVEGCVGQARVRAPTLRFR